MRGGGRGMGFGNGPRFNPMGRGGGPRPPGPMGGPGPMDGAPGPMEVGMMEVGMPMGPMGPMGPMDMGPMGPMGHGPTGMPMGPMGSLRAKSPAIEPLKRKLLSSDLSSDDEGKLFEDFFSKPKKTYASKTPVKRQFFKRKGQPFM